MPFDVGFEAVPFSLERLRLPAEWHAEPARPVVSASAQTDWFIDPISSPVRTAPVLVGLPPTGDFTWEAHVVIDGDAMFDAAGLFVYQDDDHRAKLAVEVTAAGPTIVSVVTATLSDDCNSTVLAQSSARLRLARVGEAIAFHASGGGRWELSGSSDRGARRHASASSARLRPAPGARGASTYRSPLARSATSATAAERRAARVVSPPPPRPATAAPARSRSGRCPLEPSRSSPRRRAGPPAPLVLIAELARRLAVARPDRDASAGAHRPVDERPAADEVAAVAQIGSVGEMPILELGGLLVRELRCVWPAHEQHERVPVELHAAN